MLLLMVIIALPLGVTFWAILDIPKRRFPEPRKQIRWLWIVATLPLIGAVFYLIAVRPNTEPAREDV